jgi:hypothetical protein
MAGSVPSLYQFQRSSPFYPLITNYQVLLHGFIALGTAGVALKMKQLPPKEVEILVEDARRRGNLDLVQGLMKTNHSELHPPLVLVSGQANQTIQIDAEVLMRELAQNTSPLVSSLKQTAVGSLLIHAYAVTEPFRNKNPLWEFLRHCRNAAAHGGRFNLLNGEPHRPAVWGRFTITPAMQGTPLVATAEQSPGLLAPGDPLRLLWDIEQAFPNIISSPST